MSATPDPPDLLSRFDALESVLGERLGALEELVRSEDVGRRLKALELVVEERYGRIEETVRTAELEARVELLAEVMDERLAGLSSRLAPAPTETPGAVEAALAERMAGLEGTVRHLEEQTVARLDRLGAARTAADAEILEKIVAGADLVGAHFAAFRPLIEVAAGVRPELDEALADVKRLLGVGQVGTVGAGGAPGAGSKSPSRADGLPRTVAAGAATVPSGADPAAPADAAQADDAALPGPEATGGAAGAGPAGARLAEARTAGDGAVDATPAVTSAGHGVAPIADEDGAAGDSAVAAAQSAGHGSGGTMARRPGARPPTVAAGAGARAGTDHGGAPEGADAPEADAERVSETHDSGIHAALILDDDFPESDGTDALFLPPEETPIPDRRFGMRRR